MDAVQHNLRPRDICTRKAFENAIAGVAATGGSTNAVLHLLAMAREAEVPLSIDDFDHVSARTPVLVDLKPGGRFMAADVDKAGGIGVIEVDVTLPTVTITSPTSNPSYSTGSSSVTLGGTASDNIGVTQVTWGNSRGGSGTATGTTSWTASGIVLQAGSNVLTVTARDAAGNTATGTLTVTVTALTFTDDPLATSTPIKAIHVTELRAAIASVRAARGLAAFAWTDPTLTPGSTGVKAVHVTELRTALNQAYQAAGRALPTYTDPTLAPGGATIKAIHLDELRTAVSALQ